MTVMHDSNIRSASGKLLKLFRLYITIWCISEIPVWKRYTLHTFSKTKHRWNKILVPTRETALQITQTCVCVYFLILLAVASMIVFVEAGSIYYFCPVCRLMVKVKNILGAWTLFPVNFTNSFPQLGDTKSELDQLQWGTGNQLDHNSRW